jgi:hypothetical protein
LNIGIKSTPCRNGTSSALSFRQFMEPTEESDMNVEQLQALLLLHAHRYKWVRPGNPARLLSYLSLALRGFAIATEDENGFRFQLAPARQEVAA